MDAFCALLLIKCNHLHGCNDSNFTQSENTYLLFTCNSYWSQYNVTLCIMSTWDEQQRYNNYTVVRGILHVFLIAVPALLLNQRTKELNLVIFFFTNAVQTYALLSLQLLWRGEAVGFWLKLLSGGLMSKSCITWRQKRLIPIILKWTLLIFKLIQWLLGLTLVQCVFFTKYETADFSIKFFRRVILWGDHSPLDSAAAFTYSFP